MIGDVYDHYHSNSVMAAEYSMEQISTVFLKQEIPDQFCQYEEANGSPYE